MDSRLVTSTTSGSSPPRRLAEPADTLTRVGVLTPLAIRIGGISWMPRLLPQIVWVDTRLQRVSRGRFTLLDVAGLPNLTLTVPGRRTGEPRSTPLLCVPYENSFLVAGSYFGGPKEPMWVANLEAAMSGEIRVGGRTKPFTAAAVHGAERERMWAHMLETWPNFAKYEQRTSREIKLFELTPTG
jgi:deazaflavin-dependent oxidoreductase (nitroreductase family)